MRRVRIGVTILVMIVAAAALLAGPLGHGYSLSEILSGAAPLLPGGFRGEAGTADLSGTASLDADQRPVTLRVTCDPDEAGLTASLTVPRIAELPRFDFAGLEGYGSGALLAAILVSGPDSVRSVRMPVQGAATWPDGGFILKATGARGREDPPRAVALTLVQPGAKLTWTQASQRSGDPVLKAEFTVQDADAAALKTALRGCIAAPF